MPTAYSQIPRSIDLCQEDEDASVFHFFLAYLEVPVNRFMQGTEEMGDEGVGLLVVSLMFRRTHTMLIYSV